MNYTVQSGDTLGTIAAKLLGSSSKYKDIYDLNKDVIGADMNKLEVGMVLKMPDTANLPAVIPASSGTPSTATGGFDKKYLLIGAAAILLILFVIKKKGK